MKTKNIIITLAGKSSRFTKTCNEEFNDRKLYHKSLYSTNDSKSILYRLLKQIELYKKYYPCNLNIIIVTGYMHEEVFNYIYSEKELEHISSFVTITHNHEFEKGSNLSFCLGIKEILNQNRGNEEFYLIEGDLFIDFKSLKQILNGMDNFNTDHIITCSGKPIISAETSVMGFTVNNKIFYNYDPKHKDFYAIVNFEKCWDSGQIWGFKSNSDILRNFTNKILESEFLKSDTNLNLVKSILDVLDDINHVIITFEKWHNINTLNEYNLIKNLINDYSI